MGRSYDNSRREAQARQTREAILEAARSLMGDDAEALSNARIAARAGVSEPTVYRHFPNRDALVAALAAHVHERLRGPTPTERAEDLPAGMLASGQYFGEHEAMLRAAVRTGGLMRDLREAGRRERQRRLRAALEAPTSHLRRREGDAVRAFLQHVMRAETWLALRESGGIDADQAAEVTAWAMRALLDALARDRARGVTELVDDATRARASELRDEPDAADGARRQRGRAEGPRRRTR